MDEIISLLKTYSPPVVLLLVIIGIAVFFLKLIIERSIETGFNAHKKGMELTLERQSAFKDKVLLERYTQIGNLSARLEKILTNVNRIRLGGEPPAGFKVGNEIVVLTEVFEDLQINRLTLTEEFYELFVDKSNLLLKLANADSDAAWNELAVKWKELNEKIRTATEDMFKLSEIRSY